MQIKADEPRKAWGVGWDSKLKMSQRAKVDIFLTLRMTFIWLVIEQVEPSNKVKSKTVSPLSFEEVLSYSWVQFSPKHLIPQLNVP